MITYMNLKIGTRKVNAVWSKEMLEDLNNFHGLFENKNKNMLHYEYTATEDREIELIKEHAEIDYLDDKHVVYSITKKQLRQFKLGAIDGIREYARMKKIIYHSEVVQDVERILELKLSKEIGKEIDKEIMKEVLKKASPTHKNTGR